MPVSIFDTLPLMVKSRLNSSFTAARYGIFDPQFMVRQEDDFTNVGAIETGEIGTQGWLATASGTGAAASSGGTVAGRVGLVTVATGTTATGRTALEQSTAVFNPPGTEDVLVCSFSINVPTLSTVAEEFVVYAGFGDAAAAEVADGAYVSYDRLTDGDFWAVKTAQGSTRSKTVTAMPAVAGRYLRGIIVWTGGTGATFYLYDGVNSEIVTTITTNLPSGSQQYGPFFQIRKSAGTTSRTAIIDYYNWYLFFASARY